MVFLTKKKVTILITGLFVFLLSISFSYNYTDFSSNMSVGSGHAFTAKSLASSHNFNVDEYWGNAGADVIKTKNGYYLPYAPLNPVIIAVPYFFTYKIAYFSTRFFLIDNSKFTIFESLGMSLPSSLALVLILFGLYYYQSKNKAKNNKLYLILPTILVLGTTLFTYSVSYFNHIFSAFLCFYAFLFLISKYKFRYLISGLLVGLSFLNEFPSIFFSVGVGLAEIPLIVQSRKKILSSIKDLAIFSIPIVIAIVLLLLYNKLNFGDYFLFGEHIFRIQRELKGDRYFSFNQNILLGLYGTYISPLKGLFVYSPFLIFSFVGFKEIFKNNKYQFTLLASFVVIISLLYSAWNDCFGATVFGNRYLVMLIPFWGIGLLQASKKIWETKYFLVTFLILSFYSIIQILLNTYSGIADYKMGKCEYINTYSPIQRIVNNFYYRSPKSAPALMKLFK